MGLKDNLESWYIENIIIPNFVRYDTPGFIITEQSNKFGYTYQRDLLFSENFISDVEIKFSQKYGNKGKLFLYWVGKNFGWNYGKSFNIPTIASAKETDVIEIAKFLSMFIGATWAETSKIEKIDIENKNFEIAFQNYVVCSLNGLGYLLNQGGIAGLWCWMVSDFNVEGIQIKCQGRRDKECRTICAPFVMLKRFSPNVFSATTKLETDSSTEKYLEFNKIRPISSSESSVKVLMANNIISYEKGKMTYNGERYLPMGIDLLFLLESQARTLQNGTDLLFQIAFDHGSRIAQKEKNISTTFMSDFMSFQGWGDLLITNSLKNISIRFYPWHDLYPKTGKEIFLGLLSGFISIYKGKRILLKTNNENLNDGFVSFDVVLK